MGYWAATKTQTVERHGVRIQLQPGDPYPEAGTLSDPKALADLGFIRWLNRSLPDDFDKTTLKKQTKEIQNQVEVVSAKRKEAKAKAKAKTKTKKSQK